MNKQLLILFSIIANTAYISYANSFQKECMAELSLEELRALYTQRQEEIAKTPEDKKKELREKEFSEKSMEFSTAMGKCFFYSHYCAEADKLRREASYAKEAVVYATNRLKTVHPDFAALEMCVHEREYEGLRV